MTTLHDAFNAELDSITKARADLDAREADVKSKISSFGPWLQHEVDVVEQAITSEISKFTSLFKAKAE